MDPRDLANKEADRIEADETLTDDEKRRYLRDLGEELDDIERNQSHSYNNPDYHDFMNDRY